jgi:hypothetical protein
MKFNILCRVAAVAAALLVSFNARADWAQSIDPLVIQPAPRDNLVQAQNPPGFTWARYPSGPASYQVELTLAGSAPTYATVERNWYLPNAALPLGNYSWRVRPSGSTDWSSPRTFALTSRSTVFEVPDNATLRATILRKPRPRALPPSFIAQARWNAAQKAVMEPYASRMANEVKLQIGALPPLSDRRWPLAITSPLTAAMAAQQTEIRSRINEARRLVVAPQGRGDLPGRGAQEGR